MTSAERATDQLVADNMTWARGIARQALRTLPDSIDLDDLVDVAQIALWRAAQAYRDDYQLAGYSEPVCFKAFARRRVYYACLMAYRGTRYREACHEELQDSHADRQNVERTAELNELPLLLRRARRSLSPMQKRIVTAHYLQQRSLQEAARMLGISETWASIQHREALAVLKDKLIRRGIRGVRDCV